MARLSLAKLERYLNAAADILRREGKDAATCKDYTMPQATHPA